MDQKLRIHGPLGKYVVDKWTSGASITTDEFYFHFSGVRLDTDEPGVLSRNITITLTGVELAVITPSRNITITLTGVELAVITPSRNITITLTGVELAVITPSLLGDYFPPGLERAIGKLIDKLEDERKAIPQSVTHNWLASMTGGGGTQIVTQCRKCGVIYNASSPPSDKCTGSIPVTPFTGNDESVGSVYKYEMIAVPEKKKRPERKPRFTKDDSDD